MRYYKSLSKFVIRMFEFLFLKDGDPKMTRYQEEMLQRVIELQAITAGQNMEMYPQ